MKFMVKSTAAGLFPGHPNAKPGWSGQRALNLEVTGLPEGSTVQDAIDVLNVTPGPDWLFSIDSSQKGTNLYRVENLTLAQIDAAPKWWQAQYAREIETRKLLDAICD